MKQATRVVNNQANIEQIYQTFLKSSVGHNLEYCLNVFGTYPNSLYRSVYTHIQILLHVIGYWIVLEAHGLSPQK